MLDLRRQLFQVARELSEEVLGDPHAGEHSEELAELLHLLRALQYVELVYVRLGELLCHGQRRDLPAAHLVGQEVSENVKRQVHDSLLLEFR